MELFSGELRIFLRGVICTFNSQPGECPKDDDDDGR